MTDTHKEIAYTNFFNAVSSCLSDEMMNAGLIITVDSETKEVIVHRWGGPSPIQRAINVGTEKAAKQLGLK